MARKLKTKNNLEERFKLLYNEKGISGNAELLRKMYHFYYKGKPKVTPDRQRWVESRMADFGKMIRGERSFPESDIMAIERAIGMSWVDIIEPLPAKREMSKELDDHTLRRAAYYDDESEYLHLSSTRDVDDYTDVICNCDEYGKTIIDYILEYKSKRGLSFLIENGYIYLTRGLEIDGRVYHSEDKADEILDFLFSLDNAGDFLKLLGEARIGHSASDRVAKQIALGILQTNNIFASLCKPFVDPETGLSYMSPILFETLKCALESNSREAAQMIISAYSGFLDDAISAYKPSVAR